MSGTFSLTKGDCKRLIYSLCCKRVCYRDKQGIDRCSICHESVNVRDFILEDINWDDRSKKYADTAYFDERFCTKESAGSLVWLIEEHFTAQDNKDVFISLLCRYPYPQARQAVVILEDKLKRKEDIINKFNYLKAII